MKLPVSWQALLDAYQGFHPQDASLRPWLRLDTGELTCPALLDPEAFEDLEFAGQLRPAPIKGPEQSLRQRAEFVESLCDLALAEALGAALAEANPFFAFDAALAAVPVESARWKEEERHADLRALSIWLRRVGVEPDPPMQMTRTIIEFPRDRTRGAD